jgi:hypothetical protein
MGTCHSTLTSNYMEDSYKLTNLITASGMYSILMLIDLLGSSLIGRVKQMNPDMTPYEMSLYIRVLPNKIK